MLKRKVPGAIHCHLRLCHSGGIVQSNLNLACLRENNRPEAQRMGADRGQTDNLGRVVHDGPTTAQVVGGAPCRRWNEDSVALDHGQ